MNNAKIKVVGVGGGGSNMVEHMIQNKIENIDTIVANTDIQALETSSAKVKIQLGEKLTKGLGAGMIPEKGEQSAVESYEELIQNLENNDIVFISAGLGGGTGTGAAPIVAKAAKEVGALTVAVVTKPFRFEGKKRNRLATEGLEKLREYTDSIIVIPNDKLLSIIDSSTGTKDAFKIVDEVLTRAVKGISDVIQLHGENDVNLDFADVRTIMNHKGIALMGIGEFKGEDSALMAIEQAINSPLLDDVNIDGSMGVLVNFYINPNYPLLEISKAMELIYENVDEDANVMFGTTTNDLIPIDEVKVTIIATGFEEKSLIKKTPINIIENNLNVKKEVKKDIVEEKLFDLRKKMINLTNIDYNNSEELELPSYTRKIN